MGAPPELLAALGARPPQAADAPFLAQLYASTRPDLLGKGGADPAFAATLIAMQQRLQAADYLARFPQAHTLVIERDDTPVARLVLDIDAGRMRLVDIAVLPAYRGCGLGTALLLSLQQWAARQGLPLCLAVQRANTSARRLYLALGFLTVGADPHVEQLSWRPS